MKEHSTSSESLEKSDGVRFASRPRSLAKSVQEIATAGDSRHTEISRRRLLMHLGRAAASLPLAMLPWSLAATLADDTDPRRAMADEIERILLRKILAAWYPRCLDNEHGGFHENFAEVWTRGPAESKFLVFQARMTWVPAAVALAYPQHRKQYVEYTRHGLRFLAENLWDAGNGGFVDRTDATGKPDRQLMPWKQMYSLAFGIYAAAGAYEATGDDRALDLAKAAFQWIDRHAHDPEHGGYFEHLSAEGRPVAVDIPNEPLGKGLPLIGHVGHKSMNAHIHVLEALIALRRVWENAHLTERLDEVFQIVRDKIAMPGGHLAMFCSRDFTPVDERSSFGHELETAYLLLEAIELLDRDDDQKTRQKALELVNHSLRWGWDEANGGFYDEGPTAGAPTPTSKVWWVQPEGMNGLLTAARIAGNEASRYEKTFASTWQFFRDNMVDHKHGGCFDSVSPEGNPLPGRRHKATPWKTAYHVTRAMLFAIHNLRHESNE